MCRRLKVSQALACGSQNYENSLEYRDTYLQSKCSDPLMNFSPFLLELPTQVTEEIANKLKAFVEETFLMGTSKSHPTTFLQLANSQQGQ